MGTKIYRRSLLCALLALMIVCLDHGAIAAEDGYKVVVNPDNPISALDRDFVRDAYLKKTTEWNTGATIRPIDLTSRFSARDRFTQDILRKTPSQLKNYWNQQVFSGKGVPPPEADAVADVVAYVLEHPGAIGYLPVSADSGKAKTIKVN
jgi:ABC-type phosphate transport system substrate-binding protein